MTESEITDAEQTYPMPEHGWTCFFCGENFKKYGAALDHFGARPDAAPAGCLLKVMPGEERGLLMTLRKAEEALRACRQTLDKRTIALNRLLSIVEDDDRDMTGEAKLRDLKRQSKAKDAFIEAVRQGRPSIRAFLDHFNPNNLLENTGRQWIATSEMLDRIDAAFTALDNLPSVAKETDDAE